jgi:hypothetical protein
MARRHLEALFSEAADAGVSKDAIARALLNEILRSWIEDRPWTDVADELRFTADHLDPDQDFMFMRP